MPGSSEYTPLPSTHFFSFVSPQLSKASLGSFSVTQVSQSTYECVILFLHNLFAGFNNLIRLFTQEKSQRFHTTVNISKTRQVSGQNKILHFLYYFSKWLQNALHRFMLGDFREFICLYFFWETCFFWLTSDHFNEFSQLLAPHNV